jgi:hypothetical protein
MSSISIFPSFQKGFNEIPSSRLLIKIPSEKIDFGITGGDVVRYDTIGLKYKKAIADNSFNSEIFGIAESVNSDGSLNVVINGSIIYPENKLVNLSVSGDDVNLGSNDIYFLSGNTAGLLENIVTSDKIVIKPIFQKAPHGSYTGIVRNYLGYKQGNLSTVVVEENEFFLSFSDDLTKLITISEELNKLFVYSISYSSLTFTATLLDSINFSNLTGDAIEFDLETSDAKVSNNGYDILIFTKQNNKIFHINRQSTIQLKAQIDADLTGNAVDKLWAVDDELSSMALSTMAMSQNFNNDIFSSDSMVNSSKIKYFYRSLSGKNKFNWKIVNEGKAPGFVTTSPFMSPLLAGESDALAQFLGSSRTNKITCKKDYYVLSTKTLIQDQIDYKTFVNGYSSERYNNTLFDFLTLINDNIEYQQVQSVVGDDIQYQTIRSNTSGLLFFNINQINTLSYPTINQMISAGILPSDFYNSPQNKIYKCSFGVRNFKIKDKIGQKYITDFSCLNNSSFTYYHPFHIIERHYLNDFSTIYPSGLTYLNKLMIEENVASIYPNPVLNQDAIWSSCACSDNFFILAFLYNWYNDTINDKNLLILKFPLYGYENDSIFSYFEFSTKYNSVIPDPSGYGLISSFKSTSPIEQINKSVARLDTLHSPVYENPIFFNDSIPTLFNVNQLNSFELHTSNDRYFLCTSTYTLIWTYSSGTYIIKNIDNLDSYKFSYSADGEFFIKNNKILRYNSSTEEFEDITVTQV